MKRFSQFVVSEAVTQGATNTEMAICYQYNFKRTKDQTKALSDSGISDKDFKISELIERQLTISKCFRIVVDCNHFFIIKMLP